MKKFRAQSSLEFLYTVGFSLLIFVITLVIFAQGQSDAASLSAYVESVRICRLVSDQISAIDSSGEGTSAALLLPDSLAGLNYTVFVSGPIRSIAVNYGSQGTGCLFSTSNITNGSSSSFHIAASTTIKNSQGGVVVG